VRALQIMILFPFPVIPAKAGGRPAGIHSALAPFICLWIPAFAGMTGAMWSHQLNRQARTHAPKTECCKDMGTA